MTRTSTRRAVVVLAAVALGLTSCGAGIEERPNQVSAGGRAPGTETADASGDPEAPDAAPGTPVAVLDASVEQTSAVDSGHYEMVIMYDTTDDPSYPLQQMRAVGEFADGGRRLHVSLDMTPASAQLDETLVDGTVYISASGAPGSDVGCQSVDLSSMIDGVTSGGGSVLDPTAQLDLLAGIGGVSDEGRLDVRGVSTSHLASSFTLRDAIEATPSDQSDALSRMLTGFPDSFLDAEQQVDVFVDDDGLLRRVQTASPAVELGGTRVPPYTTIVDYFDFGAEVAIEAPDNCTEAPQQFNPVGTRID